MKILLSPYQIPENYMNEGNIGYNLQFCEINSQNNYKCFLNIDGHLAVVCSCFMTCNVFWNKKITYNCKNKKPNL